MIQAKDLLHYYLGGTVSYQIIGDPMRMWDYQKITGGFIDNWESRYENLKIHVRPLSDMTEEEKRELQNICDLEKEDMEFVQEFSDRFFPGEGKSFGTAHLTNILQWATGVHYLLSKHFDLFGLIESGQAIDKTTINN